MTTCAIVPATGGPEMPPLSQLQDALESRLWFSEWAIPERAIAFTFKPEDMRKPIDELNHWIKNRNAWVAARRIDPEATPPAVEVLNGRDHKHVKFNFPHLMMYSREGGFIVCFEMDARPNAEDGKLPLIPAGAVKRITMAYWDVPDAP